MTTHPGGRGNLPNAKKRPLNQDRARRRLRQFDKDCDKAYSRNLPEHRTRPRTVYRQSMDSPYRGCHLNRTNDSAHIRQPSFANHDVAPNRRATASKPTCLQEKGTIDDLSGQTSTSQARMETTPMTGQANEGSRNCIDASESLKDGTHSRGYQTQQPAALKPNLSTPTSGDSAKNLADIENIKMSFREARSSAEGFIAKISVRPDHFTAPSISEMADMKSSWEEASKIADASIGRLIDLQDKLDKKNSRLHMWENTLKNYEKQLAATHEQYKNSHDQLSAYHKKNKEQEAEIIARDDTIKACQQDHDMLSARYNDLKKGKQEDGEHIIALEARLDVARIHSSELERQLRKADEKAYRAAVDQDLLLLEQKRNEKLKTVIAGVKKECEEREKKWESYTNRLEYDVGELKKARSHGRKNYKLPMSLDTSVGASGSRKRELPGSEHGDGARAPKRLREMPGGGGDSLVSLHLLQCQVLRRLTFP